MSKISIRKLITASIVLLLMFIVGTWYGGFSVFNISYFSEKNIEETGYSKGKKPDFGERKSKVEIQRWKDELAPEEQEKRKKRLQKINTPDVFLKEYRENKNTRAFAMEIIRRLQKLNTEASLKALIKIFELNKSRRKSLRGIEHRQFVLMALLEFDQTETLLEFYTNFLNGLKKDTLLKENSNIANRLLPELTSVMLNIVSLKPTENSLSQIRLYAGYREPLISIPANIFTNL